MTKKRIEQYSRLRKEIDLLNERILAEESAGGRATDVVRGSSNVFPYLEQKITVSGYGTRALPRLYKRKAEREAECKAIEEFVNSIEDSVIFQLFTRRYIEGKQLKEAARMIGYSERRAIQIANDFFEKNQKDFT